VKYVSIPNRSTRSAERKKLEKQRWFKRRQKGRTGCEGPISVSQAPAWAGALPISGHGWDEAMGGTGRDRGQPDEHRTTVVATPA